MESNIPKEKLPKNHEEISQAQFAQKNESDARKIYFKWLSCLFSLLLCLLLKQHKKINILKHRIVACRQEEENRKKLCVWSTN